MAKETKDLVKEIGEDIMSAIAAASGNLKGDDYQSVDEALKTVENGGDQFFNPTLSQYKEGLVINTNRDVVKMKKVAVGTGTRKAWCITAPAGYMRDGQVIYNQAFNMYPSTLRKTIQVTDEIGDQVLDENKTPVVIDGSGNACWEAAHACGDEKALLEYALDKVFKVSEIRRDFGPSVFVSQADGSRKATGHKLTSLPLFSIIG